MTLCRNGIQVLEVLMNSDIDPVPQFLIMSRRNDKPSGLADRAHLTAYPRNVKLI